MTTEFEYVGVVGVDTGTILIQDLYYGGLKFKELMDHIGEQVVCLPLVQGHEGSGILLGNSIGAGTFPVYVKKNKYGGRR